jgi:hypothetical protein
VDTKALLQEASGARKDLIGGRGRQYDQVDILTISTCHLQRASRGCLRHIARGLTVGNDMASLDASALGNPLIGRIHNPFKIMVG